MEVKDSMYSSINNLGKSKVEVGCEDEFFSLALVPLNSFAFVRTHMRDVC